MSKRILSVVLSLALLLCAVSVTGIITTAAGEPVITPVTTEKAPEGNLLAGLRPISGVVGQTGLSSNSGKPELLTDGEFAQADNTGRWCGYTSTGCLLAFNLGATATIKEFLIGSEAGTAQYADKVKIYISKTVVNPRTDLFVDSNLVLDVSGLTTQNNVVKADGKTFEGIMIGFDFTGSKCNAYDLIRLGELGAYGTENVKVKDTVVTPVTALPSGTNLLVGATAKNGSGNALSGITSNTVGLLTDGKFCTANTDSGANADRFRAYYGANAKMAWDLGDTYDINSFLIGSENGVNEYVRQVNIYVSDDQAKLFTDDSLVLSARGYNKGLGISRDNLLTSSSDKKMSGRYVGFDFSNNDPAYVGWMGSFLRLGELGVYGDKAPKGPARTPILTAGDLPAAESLIAGKKPQRVGAANEPHRGSGSAGWEQVTDGLVQGVNQKAKWKLTESPTYTHNSKKYMQPKVPKEWVEENYPELDSSKDWYLSCNFYGGLSDIAETRTVSWATGPDDISGEPVYDLGDSYTVEKVLLASSAEIVGSPYYHTESTDGSSTATITAAQLEAGLVPKAVSTQPDNTMYKVNVYVADVNDSNIKSSDNLVLSWDYSDRKTDMNLAGLYEVEKVKKGRYVCIDYSESSYGSLARVSELAVYGTVATEEKKPYTLYDGTQAPGAMIAPADNVLAQAASTGYRHDKSSGNSNDGKMLTKLVDGIISSQNGDKLCPTTHKDTGVAYYYFTYDMGEDYAIDALVYAGDGSTGANSVAVYVGDKDLATIAGGSVEPNASYEGGIGADFITTTKTGSHAIRFDFAEAVTGRYVTFRLGACRNSNYHQVWISEFGAIGEKLSGGEKAYDVVKSEEDLPEDTNLIAGMIPGRADGKSVNISSGTLSAVTDGKIPGVNQNLPTFTLTQDEQYKTAVRGGHTYYSWIAPTSLVEAQGLDTAQTWYMRPQNGQWLHTNGGEQSVSLWAGADSKPVFDMGAVSTVKSILFGSVVELVGATNSHYYDGAYDASKHPTMTEAQLADAAKILAPDKRLLWTAKVYVGDDKATIFHADNLVLEYDLSDALADARCSLWTLPEAKNGRYVAFDFNDALYAELVRVSEVAVYGERVVEELKPGVNTVSPSNFPNIPANLLQGSTKLEGSLNKNTAPIETLYDGHIGGVDVAAGGDTRVAFNGNNGGYITVGDKKIEKVNGQAKISFQLQNVSAIDKVLVAGSASDGADFSDGKTKYDNRNVLYYEVYVSEDYTKLWNEANCVLAYDNSTDPQMAQIHLLDKAVRGSYVGFKVTCGAYGIARLSELGVYGTMDPLNELTFTGFDTKEQMDALVNGQANLIKGEAVEGKPLDYLANVGSAIIGHEEWLSDGYVDWEAVEEGGTYKKVMYDNSNFATNIAYNFMGEVDFNGLMIAATGVEEAQFRAQRVTVYVGDNLKTLFNTANQVGVAMLHGANVGAYIDLASEDVQGRYIGIAIPGDAIHKQVRIAELGVYGTYVSAPDKYPQNLLSGSLPVYHQEISARSIDNRTAVDVNGHPGSGNTGEFTGEVKKVWRHDDLALLTDGSQSTRSSQWSSASPTAQADERGSNVLHYDSNWMVFVYKLGGGTRIDDIVFASSPERDYYISGVQYYASEKYGDLFKNESLLYTTGGEYFVVDEENSTAEETKYLPDASMDDNDEQTIEYSLTDEQKARNYRYVAVVLTRPHSLYKPSNPSQVLVGYSLFRAAEISVYGEVVAPEEPIKDMYTVKTSVGDVSVQVGTLHFDDRDFFDNTLGGVKVTESKLPANVVPNVDDNWLSVDNDTVFTFQLVDKNGKLIAETSAEESKGLNGRELEFQFPSTADYVQTMGVLEDGQLRRLYNSFTNIQKDRKINAGVLVYPTYADGFPNNRDKAVLCGTEISLVYMKANSYADVNKLSNRKVNDSLADFIAAGGVAGANADDAQTPWYILPILTVAMAAVTATVILMRRKARRAGQ